MKMLTLTPILSINIPPKNGNIILGAEYIEYNILNYTLFNPISDQMVDYNAIGLSNA